MASLSTRLSKLHLQRSYKSRLQLFSSTNNKNRKRKPSVRRTTVKDRIRSRATRHNIALIDTELAAERATSRLEWGRNAVSAFWRDGAEAPKSEVVMDANWWFWNIMLALSPAAFIALYCEFVGKPAMRKSLEEGATAALPIPETEPTLTEIWKWIQTFFLGQPLPQESMVSSAVNGVRTDGPVVSPSTKADHTDHLQQLQELKQQIRSLEHQITEERSTPVRAEETPLERKIRKRNAIQHKDMDGMRGGISAPNPSSWSWNQWLRASGVLNKWMAHDQLSGSEYLEKSKQKDPKEIQAQVESSENEVARPTKLSVEEEEVRAGPRNNAASDPLRGHPPAVEELHTPSSRAQWWKWWRL